MPNAGSNLYGKWWLPVDVSTHGAGIDSLINWVHVLMILMFVGWGCFFVYCLVNFRHRDGHKATYAPVKGKITKVIEAGALICELIFLFVLSMPIWAAYRNVPEDLKNPVHIQVTAQQFQWNVHYPGTD